MTWLDWLLPWEPSILTMLASGVSAILYLLGSRAHKTSWQRQVLFWLGLATLFFSTQSRLDYYSEHSFFVRQIQDSFLHHTCPFLIAVSRPGVTLLAGLPAAFGPWMKRFLALPPLRHLITVVNQPFVAVSLFVGVTALWLIPRLQLVAMLDQGWNQLMDWSMVINGLMFWGLVLNAHALRPARSSPGYRIVMMLAVVPPQIVLGALLFSASRPLYPVYSLCGLIFQGIDPLADQQIGGLILWIHGAMMSVLGILIVIRREWMATPKAAIEVSA